MTSFRGLGTFGAFFGAKPSRDEWNRLNPELMELLHCSYRSSHLMRTVVSKLTAETLRGGVSLREMNGSKSSPSARELSPGEQHRLQRALKRAIVYGLLYGMVPVALDKDRPDTVHIPPPGAGHFVARMDDHGYVEVGWQWSDRGLGLNSAAPDRDVWVFVWEDREPLVGNLAPFDSVVLPLLPELLREREMVDADTQANYELSRPPAVLQENPRASRDDGDRQVLELFLSDALGDPGGRRPGHGPGGTLTGAQSALLRTDMGASERAQRSRFRGQLGFAGDATRLRMDPCSGQMVSEYRTVAWQRGTYLAPAGTVPSPGFARPTLRGDLLAQRNYLAQLIAAALGVPMLFVFGGSEPGGSGRRSDTGMHSWALQQSAACEALRDTVSSVRTELSALYAQAHYQLVWQREAVGLSRKVARAEATMDQDSNSEEAMARQLQLLGTTLADVYTGAQEKRVRETGELHRAAEIAAMAQKLWQGARLRQSVDAVLGIVAGVRDGDTSLKAVQEREKRGEGFEPADPTLMRDPDDDGDPTKPPWRSRAGSKDPNELAETLQDRRSRIQAQGRTVAGSTLINRGGPGGQSGYQRRALTEEVPDLGEMLTRARDIVDARLQQLERTDQMLKRLRPVSGERGETKIELVWRTPPVPDWAVMREMALDDVVAPRLYRTMVLSHLGFDPDAAAPRQEPFFHLRAATQTKRKAAAPARATKTSQRKRAKT